MGDVEGGDGKQGTGNIHLLTFSLEAQNLHSDTYPEEMKPNGNRLTHTHRCLVQNNQAWKPPTLGDISPWHYWMQLKGTSG